MSGSKQTRRRFYPTPHWLVLFSLATTGLLYLSERFQWFAFNQHKGWTVLIAVAAVGVVLLFLPVWLCAALLFRQRFHFSLRSWLLLALAVALPFSWMNMELKKASRQVAGIAEIEKLGGQLTYDGETLLQRTCFSN